MYASHEVTLCSKSIACRSHCIFLDLCPKMQRERLCKHAELAGIVVFVRLPQEMHMYSGTFHGTG